MTAEVLSYARSRGLFAGAELSGAVVKQDREALFATYGPSADVHAILMGNVAPPKEAAAFLTRLGAAFGPVLKAGTAAAADAVLAAAMCAETLDANRASGANVASPAVRSTVAARAPKFSPDSPTCSAQMLRRAPVRARRGGFVLASPSARPSP